MIRTTPLNLSLQLVLILTCSCGDDTPLANLAKASSPQTVDPEKVAHPPIAPASPHDAGAPDSGIAAAEVSLLDQMLERLPSMGFDAVEDDVSPPMWMGARRRALAQAGLKIGKGLRSIRIIRFRSRAWENRDGRRWYPEGWIEQWAFSDEAQAASVAQSLVKTKGRDAGGTSYFFGRSPYAMYRKGDKIVSILMRGQTWAAHVGNVAVLVGFIAEGSLPPLEEILYMAGTKPRGLGGPETDKPAVGSESVEPPPPPTPVPIDEAAALKLVGGVPWPAKEMMSIRLSPGEAGRAMVLVGAPEVNGPLSEEQVGSVVLPGLDSLDACYEKYITVRPGLSGTMLLDVVVTSMGRVDSSTPRDSTIDDADLEKCLAVASKKWRFPAFEGDRLATVTVPLRLDSGE